MSEQNGRPDAPSHARRDTRHRSIAQILRDEIASGLSPVGRKLAGEHDLCARFQASRHTVRDALRLLAAEGLVERRQGAGTRVVSRVARDNYVQSMQSLDELRQYAADTVLSISSVGEFVLPASKSSMLQAEAGTRWLRILGVRSAGDEIICATEVFVHHRFVPLLADLSPGVALTSTVYTLVATRSGELIAGAEQDIAARPLPRNAANSLGLPSGASALLLVRRYLSDTGQVMVCSMNWHPAERFTYRMRLQRE